MNLIFQDAQDAAGMNSECSGCELILFPDVPELYFYINIIEDPRGSVTIQG